jgi:hypothetical protein
MKNYILTMVVFFTVILMPGCKKFTEVDVSIQNEKLVFSAMNSNKNKKYKLHELSVYKKNCVDDCIMWRISYDSTLSSNKRYIALENGEVVYGQIFVDYDLDIPAKKLSPGSYEVGGSISIGKKEAYIFSEEFELLIDDLDKLTVITQ